MPYKEELYVVGIGASAGGLEAVQQFFSEMPDDTGVSFIVIQHLSPDFISLMPELLAKYTDMPIYTAELGQDILPNSIYLNQRNKNIGIEDNKFILLDKAPKDHLNLPIDILFHMLGESYKDKSIGVVLSGTGSDGSRGIKTIKEAGGTILVQDPETAQFNGMPNSAILTNIVDFVLSPQAIAHKIVQFTSKRLLLNQPDSDSANNETMFLAILSEVQKTNGINFKKYKYNTLLRRIEKRMSLHNIETLNEYNSFVMQNEKERLDLNQEFLIGVTSFFRDKEAFAVLQHTVIPEICQDKAKHDTVRIWIPGCSSGEEVYSIAILFEDYIRQNKLGIDYKIFATDIDRNALNRASQGSYPVNNCAEIDKRYLEEYFLKTGDKIQIIKKIRERIVFSYHDLISDPPFIKVDLVSCRNLLIYFANTAQKTVLANFQYALNKDGFLFLGSSESLGSITHLFKIIDSKQKIFRSTGESIRHIQDRIFDESPFRNISTFEPKNTSYKNNSDKQKKNELFYYKYLSQKHSPISVFVDTEFNVKFIIGEFKKWFNQADGVFSNSLLNMVSPDLATIIRNGVRKLKEDKSAVCINNITSRIGEEIMTTDLLFEQVKDKEAAEDLFLIQFSMGVPSILPKQIVLTDDDVSNLSGQRIEELEYELKESRSELQNVVEELEASNEELQSANEELMSSNEELQSANEELQSVNEELYTVNSEFQEKNKELEDLNDDITNLLNSTDIGTLFLDNDLNIRKFTPALTRIFNLEYTDIGRSIISFASSFDDEARQSIINDSKLCLSQLRSFEKELKDNKGNWYLKRISPFITGDKKIDGVVITFVDISNYKTTKHELGESEHRLNIALEAGNMAWWEMELPSGAVKFNPNKTTMLGRNAEDFTVYQDFTSIVHPDDYESAMQAMLDHLEGRASRYECQYRIQHTNGEYLWFHDIGKIVSSKNGVITVSGIVIEITEKKHTELKLIDAIRNAERANQFKNQFLANMSHEIRTPMNGLVGFSGLLSEENLSVEERNSFIDIIQSSSNQLLNLINDIIDVSKIDAGELKISIDNCILADLFNELEITFNRIKKDKRKNNILINANIPDNDKNIAIRTDTSRLKQVLNNLISNALKFTHSGSIDFGYVRNNNKIIITVVDTGIGIPQDKINDIFERFQQVEHTDGVKFDGTGLGLAITKGLIELMGGTITVVSKLNEGSSFIIELPFIPAIEKVNSNEDNTDAALQDMYRKLFLVADDEPVNREYLQRLLRGYPIDFLWAENGIEAVKLFEEHSDNIALVLMDIRMPGLNGYKAAEQILKINPNAKIVAQTAYAMASDKEKCLSYGFVDYISKPILKEFLIRIISKWVL